MQITLGLHHSRKYYGNTAGKGRGHVVLRRQQYIKQWCSRGSSTSSSGTGNGGAQEAAVHQAAVQGVAVDQTKAQGAVQHLTVVQGVAVWQAAMVS